MRIDKNKNKKTIPRAITARYYDQNFLPKTALLLFRFAVKTHRQQVTTATRSVHMGNMRASSSGASIPREYLRLYILQLYSITWVVSALLKEVFFRLRCFLVVNFSKYWLSGALLGWGSIFVLIYIEISECSPSKKTYFGTPPARSETRLGILCKFWSRTDL